MICKKERDINARGKGYFTKKIICFVGYIKGHYFRYLINKEYEEKLSPMTDVVHKKSKTHVNFS